jgi:hypothetical protein
MVERTAIGRSAAVLAVALAAAGCKPDFGNPSSLVTEHRILAARAEPPEARAGDPAKMTALVVGPEGTVTAPAIDWALCVAPKPLDENNIVTSACLDGGDGLKPFGKQGASATAIVPLLACSLFGPDPPPQMQGMPPLRPRDPDVTGGYYQPVRLTESGVTAFALVRIGCCLSQGGTLNQFEYSKTYKANQNPVIVPLTAAADGAALELAAIPAGKTVTFTSGWTADSVESFPVYDIASQKLVTHREALRVAWFATAGEFEHEVTGRSEEEPETTTDNTWTAPAQAGVVHLWTVVRDNRGGSDWASYELTIE